MSQLLVALASARTYLNDDAAVTWTDAVLIPKAQEAHRELQTDLWNNGSPVVRAQSTILALGVGVVQLSTDSAPPLPTDLINPTQLFEAPHGLTTWVPMTEVNYIPLGQAPGTTLGMWSWRGESIYLLGSTNAIDVYIQYRRLISIPVLVTDPIGIIFGESYLAARIAAMAAGSVANTEVYTAMTALSKENFGKVLAANRGQQRPGNKPA